MRLLAGLSDVVSLDGLYGVTDAGAEGFPDEPAVYDINWWDEEPGWLTAGRNAIMLDVSGPGPFHLRWEHWDQDPGDPAERSWTGRLYLVSGRITAYTLEDDGETYEKFDLGQAGVEWNCRVDWWSLREALRPEFAVHPVEGQILRFRFW
uniref:hypothetical protein n=1 Tax=Herbidospora sakaeratensis TaxID=564415 RepID=UPI0007822420|nr:hypothetical protein [Herbidospora sakaeratensis]